MCSTTEKLNLHGMKHGILGKWSLQCMLKPIHGYKWTCSLSPVNMRLFFWAGLVLYGPGQPNTMHRVMLGLHRKHDGLARHGRPTWPDI